MYNDSKKNVRAPLSNNHAIHVPDEVDNNMNTTPQHNKIRYLTLAAACVAPPLRIVHHQERRPNRIIRVHNKFIMVQHSAFLRKNLVAYKLK